jgi:hypothetical protein
MSLMGQHLPNTDASAMSAIASISEVFADAGSARVSASERYLQRRQLLTADSTH